MNTVNVRHGREEGHGHVQFAPLRRDIFRNCLNSHARARGLFIIVRSIRGYPRWDEHLVTTVPGIASEEPAGQDAENEKREREIRMSEQKSEIRTRARKSVRVNEYT